MTDAGPNTPDSFHIVDRGFARIARRLRIPALRLSALQVVAALAVLGWLVPACLAATEGAFLGDGWTYSRDVAAYVRFLWVVPLLRLYEPRLDRELELGTARWRVGIVPATHEAVFDRFVVRVQRVRDAATTATVMLVAAYVLAFVDVRTKLVGWQANTWVRGGIGPGQLSLAGWCYALVSAPLLYGFLLRWVLRYALWAVLLMRLAAIPIRLRASHPDRAAGLDGIARAHNLFAPLVLALSSVGSAGFANRILYTEATFSGLRTTEIAIAVTLLAVFLTPLFAFTPHLFAARRRELDRYDRAAEANAAAFDRQVDRVLSPDNAVDGALDERVLATHAHLANSYAVVDRTRLSLIARVNVVLFAASAVVPMSLVALTEVSPEALFERLRSLFA